MLPALFFCAGLQRFPIAKRIARSRPEHSGKDLKSPGWRTYRNLSCFCLLGPQRLGLYLATFEHLHLLPVIGKFLAAIKTNNVCSSDTGGRWSTLAAPPANWKTEALVRTTKQDIQQTRHTIHHPGELGARHRSGLVRSREVLATIYSGYFRFRVAGKGSKESGLKSLRSS